MECLGVDGIIGSNMLRNSIVQIDETMKTITITDDLSRLALQNSNFTKLEFKDKQSSPFINIILQNRDQKIYEKVVIDIGSNGFFDLANKDIDNILKRGKIIDKIAEADGSNSFSTFGSATQNKLCLFNIAQIGINNTIFNDVVVQTTTGHVSRLGSKILLYGKTTLDYIDKKFFFQPYSDANVDELTKRPFQISPTYKNGKMVVGIIWDKELTKKINIGDEILSIDEINLENMSFCDLIKRGRLESNKFMLGLKDVKTGNLKKVEIVRM